MTREEAVSIIEEHIWDIESSYVDCADIEALRMAIEALRQPEIVRCKDCKYLLPKGSFCSKDMCGLRGMAHYRHVDIHNDFCSRAERREE